MLWLRVKAKSLGKRLVLRVKVGIKILSNKLSLVKVAKLLCVKITGNCLIVVTHSDKRLAIRA